MTAQTNSFRMIPTLVVLCTLMLCMGALYLVAWPMWMRYSAARLLAKVVQDVKPAVIINGAPEYQNPEVFDEAIQRVKVVRAQQWAVEELRVALRSDNPFIRARACWALGHLSEKSHDILSLLTAALRDGDDYVQWEAAWALVRIDPDAAAHAGISWAQ